MENLSKIKADTIVFAIGRETEKYLKFRFIGCKRGGMYKG